MANVPVIERSFTTGIAGVVFRLIVPPWSGTSQRTGTYSYSRRGIVWEDMPQEMGCGCGMTCWRRLRDWQEAGV